MLNDSRVLPARLIGRRSTGGACEVLLLIDRGEGLWECLVRPGRKMKPGAQLSFGEGKLTATVEAELPGGNRLVRFHYQGIFLEILEELGRMPLPPYIKAELQDNERYQTVYSKVLGSAAAPTAGLHFTPELLRQVEEGVLDVHLTPAGQYEVRAMIHSFNAMVRRLKALIADYEERVRQGARTMPDYLHALVRGEMSPGEVRSQAAEFFSDRYLLMVVTVGKGEAREGAASHLSVELAQGFDTIPRFASRCTLAVLTPFCFLVYYRIREEDFSSALHDLVRDMKRFAKSKTGAELSFCIGRAQSDCLKFAEQLEEVMDLHDLYMLKGEGSVLDFNQCFDPCRQIARLAPEFGALAAALYIADEKTISQEKEILFRQFQSLDMEEAGNRVLAVILATARQFSGANADFFEIFGEKIDYFEKIRRISDGRSLRLWVTNYCSWVSDYSRGRLDVSRADAVTRAKHYVIEHYQNPSLTLKEVADYVDLSEKYFTTKFTKECGETFLSYLTGLRIQKAKELIKTTTFKMYEIAEMVGYNNPEHFNRTFRKLAGMSPAQYRKAPGEEEKEEIRP